MRTTSVRREDRHNTTVIFLLDGGWNTSNCKLLAVTSVCSVHKWQNIFPSGKYGLQVLKTTFLFFIFDTLNSMIRFLNIQIINLKTKVDAPSMWPKIWFVSNIAISAQWRWASLPWMKQLYLWKTSRNKTIWHNGMGLYNIARKRDPSRVR